MLLILASQFNILCTSVVQIIIRFYIYTCITAKFFHVVLEKYIWGNFSKKDTLFQDKLKISKINHANLLILVYFGHFYEGLL